MKLLMYYNKSFVNDYTFPLTSFLLLNRRDAAQ